MLRTLVTAYHSFGANTTQATNDLEELFAINNITVEYAMDNVSRLIKLINLVSRVVGILSLITSSCTLFSE